MSLNDVKNRIEADLHEQLSRCGLMYRLFGRAKTMRSLKHKMELKGEKYRAGKGKIQDVIGLRIVLYFPEDVDLLSFFFSCRDLVDYAVDELNPSTFRPQRLNLVKNIPDYLVEAFRASLPEEYAPYIDNTYEVQIRTIFSEGWHEVEHDMRYKCKEDWEGYDSHSRKLNGIIATLETAEFSMSSLFNELSAQYLNDGKYSAMLRNKLRIRLANDGFSPTVESFLRNRPEIAEQAFKMDRTVFLLSLLNHKSSIPLTFDNILYLINRIDILDPDLLALEDDETRKQLENFIAS